MGKLRDFQKRSRQLVKEWPKIERKAIENTLSIALDLITDDQLGGQGIDGDGNKLPLPYAPFTIAAKRGKSGFAGITSHITLFGEGGFHSGFFGKINGENVVTGSTDSKSGDLHGEWGESISSLSQENTAKWAREDVLPHVQDMTKNVLGL